MSFLINPRRMTQDTQPLCVQQWFSVLEHVFTFVCFYACYRLTDKPVQFLLWYVIPGNKWKLSFRFSGSTGCLLLLSSLILLAEMRECHQHKLSNKMCHSTGKKSIYFLDYLAWKKKKNIHLIDFHCQSCCLFLASVSQTALNRQTCNLVVIKR